MAKALNPKRQKLSGNCCGFPKVAPCQTQLQPIWVLERSDCLKGLGETLRFRNNYEKQHSERHK